MGENLKNSENSDFWYTSLKKNVEYGKNMKIGKKYYLTPFLKVSYIVLIYYLFFQFMLMVRLNNSLLYLSEEIKQFLQQIRISHY